MQPNKFKYSWDDIIYKAFDAPCHEGTFETRYIYLANILEQHTKTHPSSSQIQLVEMVKCSGEQHLEQYLSDILDSGGEGVILRKPNSLYEKRRSQTMKKLKVSRCNE